MKNRFQFQFLRSQTGVTLLELVVSVGIFALVLALISGLYSRFVFTQRRNIGEQTIQEDLRFALELFNREARTGYASSYSINDPEGRSLTFRNQNGLCVNVRLNPATQQLERAESAEAGTDCTGAVFHSYAALTSHRIAIDSLRFDLPDNIYNAGDQRLDRQGFITLMISASAPGSSAQPLRLQSSVASRQVIPYKPQ